MIPLYSFKYTPGYNVIHNKPQSVFGAHGEAHGGVRGGTAMYAPAGPSPARSSLATVVMLSTNT